MPRKKQDKFSISHIQEDNKKYSKLKKITFDNNTYTEIYLHFKPTIIDELLDDFASFVAEFEKTGKQLKEKNIHSYIILHAILYFSTLIENMPTDIYEKIDLFEQMLNNQYVKKIAESFDPLELAKITETMYEKLEASLKLMEQDKQMKSKFMEEFDKLNLENKDIIKRAMFGDEQDGDKGV